MNRIIIAVFFVISIQNAFAVSMCQTPYGRCTLNSNLPGGSVCYCGYDQGRVLASSIPYSNLCGTNAGICQVNSAPIGSNCGCMTPYGPAYGQIIPR